MPKIEVFYLAASIKLTMALCFQCVLRQWSKCLHLQRLIMNRGGGPLAGGRRSQACDLVTLWRCARVEGVEGVKQTQELPDKDGITTADHMT